MKRLSIYIIIVLGLLFSSCEKTIKTPKNQAKPLIVINCVLETGKPISAYIDKSTIIFDNNINSAYNIENMDIKIFENDVFIGKPHKVDQNIEISPYNKDKKYSDLYKLDHIVKEGAIYSIKADCEKFKTAEAKAQIPSSVSFSIIDTTNITIQKKGLFSDHYYNEEFLVIKILLNGNLDCKNKYQIKIKDNAMIDNNKQSPSKKDLYFYIDDETQKLQNLGMGDVSSETALLTNHNIKNNRLDIFVPRLQINNIRYISTEDSCDSLDIQEKLHIRLENISEDYYKFLKSLEKGQNSGDNPFVQPVPIFNNIKNGLGIFAGITPHIDSTIVFNYKVHNKKVNPIDPPEDTY